MALWLTADWHLGEDRFEIMQRPFKSVDDHINLLVERHNSVVGPDDEVLVVGDVVYQNADKTYLECVSAFNGKKTLIRGNHDRKFSESELLRHFHQIIEEGDGLAIDACGVSCWVTHYPSQGRPDLFNLVGHVHGAWKYQLNMFNVGVDANHFYPTPASRVPFHFKAVCDYYDGDTWIAYDTRNSQFRGVRGKNTFYFQRG